MVYSNKEYGNIFKEFQKNRAWLNDVEIEIVGGENEVDPLVLLRLYDQDPTVDTTVEITTLMVVNRTVRFTKGGKLLHEVTYKPGTNLSDSFAKMPYLLDMLLKLCYGLMVKKLTPPSEDSENEERQ